MSWLAAGVVGASVAGGLLGSSSQSKAAKKAAKYELQAVQAQIASIEKMYTQARADLAPYRDVGQNALYSLAGYKPTTTQEAIPEAERQINPEWERWYKQKTTPVAQPTPPGWQPSDIVGPGSTPPPAPPTNIGPEPQKYIGPETRDVTTYQPGGESPVDPYFKALEELTFELDPDDPIYKWRQEEGEKAINQALAARGLHDSSYAVNRIGEFNKSLQAEEVNRQYQQNYLREYGKLTDLYNMTYGKYMDLINLGSSAAAGSASQAQSAGGQLSQAYGMAGAAQAQNALTQGNIQANTWANLGAAPANALAIYGYGKQAGLWGTQPGTIQVPNAIP